MKAVLPLITLILCLVSLLVLSSIAPAATARQLMFFVLGAGIFGATQVIPERWWHKHATSALILACVLLLIPFIFSPLVRNTTRWISIGSFRFQPSQIAVPLTCIWVARYLSSKKLVSLFEPKNWQLYLGIAVPAGIIFASPDLGTTALLVAGVASMIWISPVPLKQIALIGLVGLIGVVIIWFGLLRDYQKSRITSFINPEENQQAAYNALQAQIAVGAGTFWGRGLGGGSQSHLRFLPERQTDFVFASFAEEFGFLGSVALVSLYTAISLILWSAAQKSDSTFGMYFLIGVATLWTVQASIHLLMNVGLFPVKGITLPLVSAGGSSVLSWMFTLGVAYRFMQNTTSKASLHVS